MTTRAEALRGVTGRAARTGYDHAEAMLILRAIVDELGLTTECECDAYGMCGDCLNNLDAIATLLEAAGIDRGEG